MAGWVIGIGRVVVAAGGEAEVRVVGGEEPLGPVPVLEALPSGSGVGPGAYRLEPDGDGGPACAATVFHDGDRLILAAIIDRIGAGQERRFRLKAGAPQDREPWRLEVRNEGVDVVAGDQVVIGYRVGPTKPYWHPVTGPMGLAMTRGWPMEQGRNEAEDHPHQRSMWFAHGDVNGVDFWASDPLNRSSSKHGRIRPTGRDLTVTGPGFAAIRTTNQWLDGDGEPVCDDVEMLRIWDGGEVRLIDVEVELHAAHGPVRFGDTKEGVFGVRVASELAVDSQRGGKIVNAEGLSDGEAWGKPSAWVDYSGVIAGQPVGLAILDHPSNLRHPTTWHVRTYGLFAANPFGYHDFGVGRPGAYTIPAGEFLRMRYRIVLHRGDAETGKVARHFRAFERPPQVEISVAD
jgi:hypothetical protein